MTVRVADAADLEDAGPGAVARWAYLGDDGGWRVHAEQTFLRGVPRIAVGELRERFAWELRTSFLDWTASLAEANDSLEWWSSELCAKNTFTMLYNRVCASAAAGDLMARGLDPGTLLVCGTPAQRDAVIRIGERHGVTVESLPSSPRRASRPRLGSRLLRLWPRVAPAALLPAPVRVSGRARAVLEPDGYYRRRAAQSMRGEVIGGEGTVLLFTWVDRRSFAADGTFRDPYFGRLSELLEAQGQRVAIVPDILPSIPFDEAVALLRACGKNVLLPDAYLTGDDWQEAARRATDFQLSISGDSSIGDLPMAALAREHAEIFRAAHPAALRYAFLVRRLAEAGVQPARVVYPYEGHSWERAVEWAVRKHLPSARLVAYENVNFSRLALSMFSGVGEAERSPHADRIVTNGETFREILIEEGAPPERVIKGCALRHEYLTQPPPLRKGVEGGPLRILAATSIHEGDAVELIERAVEAFGRSDEFHLVIKCHPVVDERRVRDSLGELGHEAHFTHRPISKLLPEVDAVLYTYTVVAYEALAYGVPPVHVKPESLYPLDQLEGATDVRWEARTSEELVRAVRAATGLDADAYARWRDRADATVRRALEPMTSSCVEAFLA